MKRPSDMKIVVAVVAMGVVAGGLIVGLSWGDRQREKAAASAKFEEESKERDAKLKSTLESADRCIAQHALPPIDRSADEIIAEQKKNPVRFADDMSCRSVKMTGPVQSIDDAKEGRVVVKFGPRAFAVVTRDDAKKLSVGTPAEVVCPFGAVKDGELILNCIKPKP